MARFHNENGKRIPYTAEEEAERDAEEQAWTDAAPEREAMAKLQALPGQLMAEFAKLSQPKRKKFYGQGLKGRVREALRDGEIAIARDLIDEATPADGVERETKDALLAIIDNAIPPSP